MTREKKKDIPLAGESPVPRLGVHTLIWLFAYANTTPPNSSNPFGGVVFAYANTTPPNGLLEFGGVVFAYAKSQIRVWTPKRGTGDSPANGISFFFSLVIL